MKLPWKRSATFPHHPQVMLYRLLGGLALVAIVVLFVRLAWAATHPSPGLPISSELNLLTSPFYSPQRYGLPERASIHRVNGTVVRNLEEYEDALAGRCNRLTLALEEGSHPRVELVWLEVASFGALGISADGGSVALRDPEAGCLLGDARWTIVDVGGRRPPTGGRRAILSQARGRLSLGLQSGETELRLVARLIDWNVQWAIFVGGALTALLGLWVVRMKRETRSSWGFLVFAILVGLFGCMRGIPHQYRSDVEHAAYWLLQCLLPAGAALFVFTFTSLRATLGRLYPVALPAGLFSAGLVVANPLVSFEEMRHGVLAKPLFYVWGVSLVLLLLLALGADLVSRSLGVHLGTTDRLRSRVFRWAAVVGFVPLSLYTVAQGFSRRPDLRLFFELTPVLFAALVAYAIVRHNLLELTELVREGVIFAVLSGALIVTYLGLGTVVGSVSDRLWPDSRGWLQAGGVTLFVLLAGPLHQRLRKKLAVRFLHRGESYEELVATREALTGPRLSLGAHCDLLAKGAAGAVGTPSALVLLKRPGDGAWWLAAATDLPPSGPVQERCLPLLDHIVESPSREIHRDDVVDSLARPDRRRRLLEGLDELRAAAVMPLRTRQRVLGALALEPRRDGCNYSTHHLDRLRALIEEAQKSIDTTLNELLYRQRRRIIALYPDAPPAIGPYAVERTLGQGGMSFVYLGRRGGQLAALKVPNHRVQGNPQLMERFFRESLAMQRLTHPNILQIYDVGWDGQEPYLVIEYCSQGSMREILERKGPLPENEVRRLLEQVARGLAAAHEESIIHRDVTLGNMFASDHGEIKLGDFGMARLVDDTTLTGSGALLGTPAYFAPETAAAGTATWSSDLYSLGICAFELLAGERPFKPANAAQAVALHLYEPLPALRERRPEVSEDLAGTIATMTAKRPGDRFPSWQAFLERLGA